MVLSFSQYINGNPTYFIEKIWSGLLKNDLATLNDLKNQRAYSRNDFHKLLPVPNSKATEINAKIHTIRADEKDKWKEGNKIHFVVNNRTKNYFEFAPIVKCKGIQVIEIKWFKDIQAEGEDAWIYPHGKFVKVQVKIGSSWDEWVKYDGIGWKQTHHNFLNSGELAINDGFETIEDFFNYFNKDYTGKIIYWTDLKY